MMLLSPGRAVTLICLAALGALTLASQTAEVTAKETPFTFRTGVNSVPVPVVVRNSQGVAVGNLGIEDFQLFDNGKQQMISRFSVEKLAAPEPVPVAAAPRPAAVAPEAEAPAPLVTSEADRTPNRFVAFLFDDLHISPGSLAATRDAARHQLDNSFQALDRAAIYTTSGRVMQEFTSDRERLHAALQKISADLASAAKALRENTCPSVDYYMADRIYNKHDLSVWKIAAEDAIYCGNYNNAGSVVTEAQITQCDASGASDGVCMPIRDARLAARNAVVMGDQDTDSTFGTIRAVITRLASMPGQRNLVLISPGFLVLDDRHEEEAGTMERAIKANVVIGGLDSRGLATDIQGGDASDRINNKTLVEKRPFQAQATLMQTASVANLAEGTGGTFQHGTNAFEEQMARVSTAPEYLYVLSFSPTDLKLDGRFHDLKVVLKNGKGLELQVRKGYYAPKTNTDPASQAKQQVEDTFFSRDEIHDLPAVLTTQYFKLESGDATVSAVAKVDIRKLTFKKENGRNRNDLTVVTGLFDNDGNFVTGAQKIVEMRLLDDTLAKRAASGISVKNDFTVRPGRYVVRLVVRDSEGQTMTAQSNVVDIP